MSVVIAICNYWLYYQYEKKRFDYIENSIYSNDHYPPMWKREREKKKEEDDKFINKKFPLT